MIPFLSRNDMEEPVWKVKVMVGERVLEREFPATDEGFIKAVEHVRKIEGKKRELEARKHIYESSSSHRD